MAFKKRKEKSKEETVSLIDFTQKGNKDKFIDELRLLSSAANGIIMVRAKELQRACEAVFEYAVTRQISDTHFHVWTVTDGWRKLNAAPVNRPSARAANPLSVDALLSDIRASEDQGDPEFVYELYPDDVAGDKVIDPVRAVGDAAKRMTDTSVTPNTQLVNVMFAPEFWFEAPGFQEQVRMFITKSMEVDSRLILLCNEDAILPTAIQSDIKILDFMPPNATELYEEGDTVIDGVDLGDDERLDISRADRERIVQNSIGMTVNEFASGLSKGIVKQDEALRDGEAPNIDLIIETISEQKAEVIKKNPCLEIMKSVDISKVGGLDLLKAYLIKRKHAFSKEAREFGVDAPKGIMCCGVPGTGKSLIAKAAANILGITCVAFDIGKVFGGLVGQSESQMRVALKTIESVAPCVLFMDEVDKGLAGASGGGGDSGTSARVFGTLLTWMQERSEDAPPIFVIMTANNVEGLPPELVRKGRLDEIFCVTFPDKKEREAILNIHLGMRNHTMDSDDLRVVVDATNQFVGAELESIVKDSILDTFNDGEKKVSVERLLGHANKLKPLYKTFPEKISAMNQWAKDNAVPASSTASFGSHEETASSEGKRNGPLIKTKRSKSFKPRSPSLGN